MKQAAGLAMRAPNWLALAFDRAWDRTYDREDRECTRVNAACDALGIARCGGAECPCANDDATPIRRLLVERVRGGWDPRTDASAVVCDVLDADLRWRFWRWAHTQAHNWSIRLRANDPITKEN